jgi:type IV pilus assembly protein PilW
MKRPLGNLRRARGFTLIEIMIGLLIGLIGIVVIMQAYAVSENYKRTATSGTDAQVNGSVALYLLERELRLAGYGMNALYPAGCTTTRVYNSTTGTTISMPLVPFQLNPAGIPAGDANTDVILIAYGNPDSFVAGVSADGGPTPGTPFTVNNNRDGFHNGDIVVGVQPGAGPGGSAACSLHEITAASLNNGSGNCNAGTTAANTLDHKVASYKNWGKGCAVVNATHNIGTGITDSSGAVTAALASCQAGTCGQLFNLGTAPAVKIYAIRGGNLTVCDWMVADCTAAANFTIAVNGIVSLRGMYGQDFDGVASPLTSAGDYAVDQWSRVTPTTANQIARTIAASLAVVARSDLIEKPAHNATNCDATTTANRPDAAITTDWYQAFLAQESPAGTLATGAINLATVPVPDWKCYRYKLFQTTVPLRNMIWRPS